jgi:RHS repeat-associated protein
VTTTFQLAGSMIVSENRNGNIIQYYNEAGSVIGLRYNGNDYFFRRTVQGDIIAILNTSGEVIVTYEYDPWGNILSTSGSMAATLGADNPFRYRGYYYDNESGFYYLQSRYYDPVTGRFLNADDTAYLGVTETTSGYNLFSYCNSNPVYYKDSFGFGPVGAIIGGILGFGLGVLLIPRIADILKLKGWARKIFIWAGIAALTGLGAYLGHYVGEAILAVYKVVGGSIRGAKGNGFVIERGKLTLRIMTSGGCRTNYMRISHMTKGALTILGTFSNSRLLTHIPITFENIIKIVQLMIKFK